MRSRLIRLLCASVLLGVVFGGPARADQSGFDPFIDQMVKSPQSSWDATLTAHRNQIGDPFLERVTVRFIDVATRKGGGDIASARNLAVLADYVEYFLGGKQQYRGYQQLYLGRLLYSAGNYNAALDVAAELAKTHPETAAGPLLEGIVAFRQGDYPRAVDRLKKATAMDPRLVEAHMYAGVALYRQHDLDGARAALEAALRIEPNNNDAKTMLAIITHDAKVYMTRDTAALEHYVKAEKLQQAKQYKEAIAEYEAAAKADPKFARPYINVGDCWLALDNVDNAVASYKVALARDPSDGQAWRALGQAYESIYEKSMDLRYLDMAIEVYARGLKAEPTYAIAAQSLQRAQEKRAQAGGK